MLGAVEIEIRELQSEDVPHILATQGGAAWNGGARKWQKRLAEHSNHERVVLLAVGASGIVGYGSLLWTATYSPFRDTAIPEIQDLVVAEGQRRKGVGTRLIRALEQRARSHRCSHVGLAVGLHSDYGPAQRLYVRLGYTPDGCGMTWRKARVSGGSQVTVDDDLVLWLVKSLREDFCET
jgi:GNAT superfamily N-acetyltransferase